MEESGIRKAAQKFWKLHAYLARKKEARNPKSIIIPTLVVVTCVLFANQQPPSQTNPKSPEVADVIATNDPKTLAATLLKERWDSPLHTDSSRPPKTLHKKLKSGIGKTTFAVFHVVGPTSTPQKRRNKEKILPIPETQFPTNTELNQPLATAIKIAESPAAKENKLAVVLVTPNSRSEAIAKIKEMGGNPSSFKIVEDPEDSIRREMGLYSTPYLLFEPKGTLVWSLRAGQRSPGNNDTADLEEALRRLHTNKYSLNGAPPPMRPPSDEGTPLFTFEEESLPGWTFIGNAWDNGASSDAAFPGLIKGFEGKKFLSSFAPSGIGLTGIAISPPFPIEKRYIHLKIGGGDLPQNTGVALVCDGTTPHVSWGKNTYEMNTVTWDVKTLQGKTAQIIVYDAGTSEMRDGILCDAIFTSDSPNPPKSFEDHHDPNNQEHANRIASQIPEDYKAFQTGDFHCKTTEGQTYLMEFHGTFPIPKTGKIEFATVPYITTPAQTVGEQKAWATINNKIEPAETTIEPINSIHPQLLEINTKTKASSQNQEGEFTHTLEITPKSFKFVQGSNPNYVPLSKEEKEKIRNTYPQCAEPDRIAQIKKEGLERWEKENDSAYLLRVTRWMQRYWTDAAPWGGWPTSGNYSNEGAEHLEIKSMSCPAVSAILDCLYNAGIPALFGQGQWLETDPNKELAGHVRVLVFLENVGWILIDDAKGETTTPFGFYTFGRETGEHYVQTIWDPALFKRWDGFTTTISGKWTSKLNYHEPP